MLVKHFPDLNLNGSTGSSSRVHADAAVLFAVFLKIPRQLFFCLLISQLIFMPTYDSTFYFTAMDKLAFRTFCST